MKRFAWFDSIRCLAVLLVIAAHTPNCWGQLPLLGQTLCDFTQQIGWMGVDLFFVLSGFLVSGLLFEEYDATGQLDIRRFLIRRGFKIIPAFYVFTLITAIYDAVTSHRVVLVHAIHDVLFIQNYRIGAWPHSWTLALEVHFYLLLVLLLWVLYRRAAPGKNWLRHLPTILVVVLIAAFVARLTNSLLRHGFGLHEISWRKDFLATHLHLDVLAAGVLLRYLYNYHPECLRLCQKVRLAWLLVALALVFPSAYLWVPHTALFTAMIPTLNGVGFSLLLYLATLTPFPQSGLLRYAVKPFDYFGRHSYSIYLWHLAAKQWILDQLYPAPRGLIYFPILVALAFILGTFFSEILELPILRLRNRLFPAASRTPI